MYEPVLGKRRFHPRNTDLTWWKEEFEKLSLLSDKWDENGVAS